MAKSEMTDSEEDGKKRLEATFGCGSSKKEPKKKSSDLTTENSNDNLCVANRNTNISTLLSIQSEMTVSEDGRKRLEAAFGCGSSKKETKKRSSDLTTENSNDNLCVANRNPSVSTQHSLLVASLVKSLFALSESEKTESELRYKEMCDMLYKMNVIDESYNMKEFEGIVMQLQHAIFNILAKKGSPLSIHRPWLDENLATSHYYREFEELEFIAGGGFGKVYKVRHKLDGTEYAVKKIPLRSESLEYVKNYLTEVKTFASLNHANIVQYKAAWLDMNENTDVSSDCEDDEDFLPSESTDHKEHRLSQKYMYNRELSNSLPKKVKEESSDFEIVFEKSLSNMETYQNQSSSIFSKKKSKRPKRNSVSEGGNALCPLDLEEINKIRFQQRMDVKWATLYIQMALCPVTLKQWLSQRNNSEKTIDPMTALVPVKVVQDSDVRDILKQLLEGLQYIHTKKIVHHDLKPSNIFLQRDNDKTLVQLGDFGLACPLQVGRHSLAFGTKLYAAPEQLAGVCDPKSDMYSLGIILFELVETFTTEMERNKYIEDLKKTGYLPPRVVVQHPEFADIIIKLLNKSPHKRPSAVELLAEISGQSPSYQELMSQLAEKEEEILRLKEMMKTMISKNGN